MKLLMEESFKYKGSFVFLHDIQVEYGRTSINRHGAPLERDEEIEPQIIG